MSVQAARQHMRKEQKLADASVAQRSRFFRHIPSPEDVAKVMALVEANFSAEAWEDKEVLSQRDYESLTRSQKIILRGAQNRRHLNDQVPPLSEQDVLRVQGWLCCGQCGALVAQSGVERHVSWDHLRFDVLVCRRCRRCRCREKYFPAAALCTAYRTLSTFQRHLAAEHGIEVPLSRLVNGCMVRTHCGALLRMREMWKTFEEARKHLLQRPQPNARPANREELRRCFGDAAQESGALMDASFRLTPVLSKETWPTDIPMPSDHK